MTLALLAVAAVTWLLSLALLVSLDRAGGRCPLCWLQSKLRRAQRPKSKRRGL